jgi:cyclopropane fatty-acyl-phospholipid synthase-like methyltransferase
VSKLKVVCDLGSGDGRIPITAASNFGAKGIGYELGQELVSRSEKNAVAEGVSPRVRFEK